MRKLSQALHSVAIELQALLENPQAGSDQDSEAEIRRHCEQRLREGALEFGVLRARLASLLLSTAGLRRWFGMDPPESLPRECAGLSQAPLTPLQRCLALWRPFMHLHQAAPTAADGEDKEEELRMKNLPDFVGMPLEDLIRSILKPQAPKSEFGEDSSELGGKVQTRSMVRRKLAEAVAEAEKTSSAAADLDPECGASYLPPLPAPSLLSGELDWQGFLKPLGQFMQLWTREAEAFRNSQPRPVPEPKQQNQQNQQPEPLSPQVRSRKKSETPLRARARTPKCSRRSQRNVNPSRRLSLGSRGTPKRQRQRQRSISMTPSVPADRPREAPVTPLAEMDNQQLNSPRRRRPTPSNGKSTLSSSKLASPGWNDENSQAQENVSGSDMTGLVTKTNLRSPNLRQRKSKNRSPSSPVRRRLDLIGSSSGENRMQLRKLRF